MFSVVHPKMGTRISISECMKFVAGFKTPKSRKTILYGDSNHGDAGRIPNEEHMFGIYILYVTCKYVHPDLIQDVQERGPPHNSTPNVISIPATWKYRASM